MKRILSVSLLSLGLLIGLFSFYFWVITVYAQAVFGGIPRIVANLAVTIFILLLSVVFIFFSVWRGKLSEKRNLAIMFLIGASLFLIIGIYMVYRFAISFPQPSQEWLAGLAGSRAYYTDQAPVIDNLLLTQGRIVDIGMGVISVLLSLILAWFGKSWFKDNSQS